MTALLAVEVLAHVSEMGGKIFIQSPYAVACFGICVDADPEVHRIAENLLCGTLAEYLFEEFKHSDAL